MAQYKVPQDVEADDKLVGPFSFRQFVYLMIAGGFIALAVALFQIFPMLALIPLPFIAIFSVVALPLRKEQPMETYLIAVVNYHLRPKLRFWTSGMPETIVKITAPKVVEDRRVRDISEDEASRRLSFLADVVDTGGASIVSPTATALRDDLLAEASSTTDIFDRMETATLNRQMAEEEAERHAKAVEQMRAAMETNNSIPATPEIPDVFDAPQSSGLPESDIIELANNADGLSVESVSDLAEHRQEEKEEVVIKLR